MSARLRLSLGPRQVQRLLLALSYAKDTIGSSGDEELDSDPWVLNEVRQYEALREKLHGEINKQHHKRGRLFLPND